jgi:DNA repair protein RadC
MESNGVALMYRAVEVVAVATLLIKQIGGLATAAEATFRKLKKLKGILKE